MALKFSEVIAGAQFRADMTNSDRVTQAEWVALLKEAIRSVWNLAAAARPDFEVTSQDSTITSGGSASLNVSDGSSAQAFHSLIDVVYSPDTDAEYSLGPFAWQNRRAPGGWTLPQPFIGAGGAARARLMGSKIYIEPSRAAGGTYRVWYAPQAKTPGYFVRLATAASLPAFTPAGTGPGHTLTANANGALSVDGVAVVAGDRILVKDETGLPGADDNGIYTVTQPGTGATPFILTRATDYDTSGAEVHIGNVIAVAGATLSEGVTNANKLFEQTTFGSAAYAGVIDTDALTFAEATVATILEPWAELLMVKTAIPAMSRDDDLDPRPLMTRETTLIAELQTYFRQNRSANGPQKMVDTDAVGPRLGGGW